MTIIRIKLERKEMEFEKEGEKIRRRHEEKDE
jgi:hypothetical protein